MFLQQVIKLKWNQWFIIIVSTKDHCTSTKVQTSCLVAWFGTPLCHFVSGLYRYSKEDKGEGERKRGKWEEEWRGRERGRRLKKANRACLDMIERVRGGRMGGRERVGGREGEGERERRVAKICQRSAKGQRAPWRGRGVLPSIKIGVLEGPFLFQEI